MTDLFGGDDERPGLPEPPPDGPGPRTLALLVGGGVALIAIVGLVVAALNTGGGSDPGDRPVAARATPAPVVPESSASPTPVRPSAIRSSASVRPSASKTSARPSSPVPSTPSGPRVVSVTVAADPAAFSTCRGTLTARLTVRMVLSQPGLPVRYTINETLAVRKTATDTTFTETTRVTVNPTTGQHQVRIAVSSPSAATAQTSIEVDCGR
ncbi:hypothetical protein [Dactylosporangium sp. CA-092794]|uniref:hypothetical protein n=1 Tax=Dactylosporangium sp. CA-092794 TaxID=3239929 RepID=UPI003D8B16E7